MSSAAVPAGSSPAISRVQTPPDDPEFPLAETGAVAPAYSNIPQDGPTELRGVFHCSTCTARHDVEQVGVKGMLQELTGLPAAVPASVDERERRSEVRSRRLKVRGRITRASCKTTARALLGPLDC